jgi:hypothetical protein
MAFRVETTTRAPQVFIVCEGHLDAEAAAAIERGCAAASAAGLDAVIRVRRGVTADRPVVARLAAYPVERLEVESPFLRSWLERVRASRARAAESDNEERRGSRSDMR